MKLNKKYMHIHNCNLMIVTFIFLSILINLQHKIQCAVLIADFSMSRMIELSARKPFCRLHTDRGNIQTMLLSSDPKRVRHVPRESVLALEGVCIESTAAAGSQFQGGLGFIYPGTKWCGPGNIATEFSDVGQYGDEDRCCREHDLCPNTLAPSECRRGLCNNGSITRSHCDCDARFRRCLQALNTEIANTLGAVFFNVVQVTCFRERRPCSIWQSMTTETSSSSSSSACSLDGNTQFDFYQSKPYHSTQLKRIDNNVQQYKQLLKFKNQFFNQLNSPFKRVPSISSRSYNIDSNSNTNIQHDIQPENDSNLYLASIKLIAKNLIRDVLFKHAGNIFSSFANNEKTTAGHNKTVADEICSQWKYRPSEKYTANTPHKMPYL